MLKSNIKKTFSLSLGALGVVYGDLGTSPLYALQQTLPGLTVNPANILGLLSLIFWSLVLVISTRYVNIFLRANNNGEGGILALLTLLERKVKKFPHWLFLIGIIGAGLLLGDSMITPAISVLSAVEGLKVISPSFTQLIAPVSFIILLILYFCQRLGTAKIGYLFGPILLCWFITIGILGGVAIYHHPTVLYAVNPYYAFNFFSVGGRHAYILLGSIFLVITGAEAMYADLGHFGRTPIRIGWFAVALPMLLLNYFGQGANLLESPSAILNSFYDLAPGWFSFPLLILATVATIIASQGVISASFSLASQAMLLNVLPRLAIVHTSKEEKGQVYIPQINYIIAIGTLALVVIFKSSNALAAAFGMAVNLVMIIVAILVIFVSRVVWNWSTFKIIQVFSIFMLIDLAFLGANLHKIHEGAWIPLVFALLSGTIMLTWDKGMKTLRSIYSMNRIKLHEIVKHMETSKLQLLKNFTAIFVTDPYDKSGGSFLHYLKLNRIMPEHVLILSCIIVNYPYVRDVKRYKLKTLSKNVYVLNLRYGFMEIINVPRTLIGSDIIKAFPFHLDLEQASFSVEIINITPRREIHSDLFYWQKKLFTFLLRNSALEIEFYSLPYNKTIAIGTYFDI